MPAGSLRERLRRLHAHAIAGVAIALAAAGCSASSLLDTLVPDEGYSVTSGIAYGSHPRQRLDVYVPDTPPPAGGRLVVVWFYGGSWKWGDRATYKFIGEALTQAGAIVVVPDYRLYPEVTFPAFVEDGASAFAWTRANIADFAGDPDQVFLAGHSAGAHIAALLALDGRYLEAVGEHPRVLRGLIGLAGPYTFNPFEFKSTRPVFASVEDADVTKPITYANGSAPPSLLLHGKDDQTVYFGHSLLLASELDRLGARSRYVPYPDRSHIGIVLSLAAPFRGRDGVYAEVTGFLRDPPPYPSGKPGARAAAR